MLRVGRISYANCTPLFHALDELPHDEGYQLVPGVPSYLNQLLEKGEIDICPSSSIAYALHSDRYLIFPDISISSRCRVKSVLLFSSVPVEKLGGKEILLSSESATSVNLLKILLSKCYSLECRFRVARGDAVQSNADSPAILLIGDSALRELYKSEGMLVYDMGELWRRWTGLPFVFALWHLNEKSFKKNPDEVRLFAKHLQIAKKHAAENLERIAEKSEEVAWMGHDRLLEYWRDNISYELGARECEGLKLFYTLAAEMGLIKVAPELKFLES